MFLFESVTLRIGASTAEAVKEQVVIGLIQQKIIAKTNYNVQTKQITKEEGEERNKLATAATSLSDLAKLAERWKYNDILKEINRLLEKQGAVSRPMTPAETQELARQQREQLATILGAQDDVKERDRENSRKGNAFWKAA